MKEYEQQQHLQKRHCRQTDDAEQKIPHNTPEIELSAVTGVMDGEYAFTEIYRIDEQPNGQKEQKNDEHPRKPINPKKDKKTTAERITAVDDGDGKHDQCRRVSAATRKND